MIVKRLLCIALFCRLYSQFKECFCIVSIEVFTAQTKDTGEDDCLVLWICLQGRANFVRQVAALGSIGVCAFTNKQCFDILE
ncbi:hypothetical protein D3C75_1142920 [compost metagenome]